MHARAQMFVIDGLLKCGASERQKRMCTSIVEQFKTDTLAQGKTPERALTKIVMMTISVQ